MHIRLATLNVWALPEPIARDVPERMRNGWVVECPDDVQEGINSLQVTKGLT